jgi:DNA-binding GntR family transcriptional regulator
MDEVNDDSLLVVGQAISLRSLVADRLRQAIVTGRFRPGSKLRERELCQLTGVSRPSLREALRQLEAEGLLTMTPHRGPMVTALTAEEVDHLYTLRRVLESFAAQEFARLRRPQDIDALKAAVQRLDDVEKKGTPFEMLEVGTDIYRAIAVGSGNPYLVETLNMLHNRIKLIRFISLHQKTRARSFAKLRALSEAIIGGDAKRAERLCTNHLESIGIMAKKIVEADYRLPGDQNFTTP